jgi:hypothetical protein
MDVEIFFYILPSQQTFTAPVRYIVLMASSVAGQKSWEKSDTLTSLRKRLDFFSTDLDWEAIERDLSEVGQHRCSAYTTNREFATHRD